MKAIQTLQGKGNLPTTEIPSPDSLTDKFHQRLASIHKLPVHERELNYKVLISYLHLLPADEREPAIINMATCSVTLADNAIAGLYDQLLEQFATLQEERSLDKKEDSTALFLNAALAGLAERPANDVMQLLGKILALANSTDLQRLQDLLRQEIMNVVKAATQNHDVSLLVQAANLTSELPYTLRCEYIRDLYLNTPTEPMKRVGILQALANQIKHLPTVDETLDITAKINHELYLCRIAVADFCQ